MQNSEKSDESCNDFIDQSSASDLFKRGPKLIKTKLMKELNYKMFSNLSGNKLKYAEGKLNQLLIKRNRSKTSSSAEYSDGVKQQEPNQVKILKGEDQNQILNGQVIIQYENGNKFQGRYQFGLRVNGKMIYFNAKCQYQGGFLGEKFLGHGKLKYFDGRQIEGDWEDMEIYGNATIRYPNNDIYYGHVDEKLYKHGEGSFFLENGGKYVGKFKNGSITGIGSYYNSKGELQAKGIWRKGKFMKELHNQEDEGFWSTLEPSLQLPYELLMTLNERDTNRIKTLQNKNMLQKDEIITNLSD